MSGEPFNQNPPDPGYAPMSVGEIGRSLARIENSQRDSEKEQRELRREISTAGYVTAADVEKAVTTAIKTAMLPYTLQLEALERKVNLPGRFMAPIIQGVLTTLLGAAAVAIYVKTT